MININVLLSGCCWMTLPPLHSPHTIWQWYICSKVNCGNHVFPGWFHSIDCLIIFQMWFKCPQASCHVDGFLCTEKAFALFFLFSIRRGTWPFEVGFRRPHLASNQTLRPAECKTAVWAHCYGCKCCVAINRRLIIGLWLQSRVTFRSASPNAAAHSGVGAHCRGGGEKSFSTLKKSVDDYQGVTFNLANIMKLWQVCTFLIYLNYFTVYINRIKNDSMWYV